MCDADIVEGEKFWEMVRCETGINLPLHVKKMMQFNGLDHPVGFGGITAETINEVETYARDVLKDILDPNEDLQLCYGPYHRNTDKFQFNTGERTIILKLVQLLKDKPLDFWRPRKEKTSTIGQERVGIMKPLTMSGHENIELERKSLRNKIKHVVNSFCEKENILEQGVVRQVSVNDLSVVVKVDEQYERENLPQSLSYRAKIQCIFCLSHTELSKVRATSKSSSRWVVTNYERHLKSCNKKRKRSLATDTSTQLTKRLKEGNQLENTEPKQVIAELELGKRTEIAETLQFPSTGSSMYHST